MGSADDTKGVSRGARPDRRTLTNDRPMEGRHTMDEVVVGSSPTRKARLALPTCAHPCFQNVWRWKVPSFSLSWYAAGFCTGMVFVLGGCTILALIIDRISRRDEELERQKTMARLAESAGISAKEWEAWNGQ